MRQTQHILTAIHVPHKRGAAQRKAAPRGEEGKGEQRRAGRKPVDVLLRFGDLAIWRFDIFLTDKGTPARLAFASSYTSSKSTTMTDWSSLVRELHTVLDKMNASERLATPEHAAHAHSLIGKGERENRPRRPRKSDLNTTRRCSVSNRASSSRKRRSLNRKRRSPSPNRL